MNVTATLGSSALLTALASSAFAIVAAIYGHRIGSARTLIAARRAIVATAALTTLAVLVLAYALLANDFSIAHVASVSSSDMQPWMKWASIYSGQPGSLLYWTWMLSLFLGAFTITTLRHIPWGAPHAIATMGVLLLAFLIALVFFASPFRINPITPLDGQGLNPLLVDSGMLIHPPALLAGLVSTAVPFTLGAAALLAGRLDAAWVRHARNWALLSFLMLSIGNFLGAWWAYTVLGWGGYWGWDPVENSAILPLLPMTAFLHALMVQERRSMLKGWNLTLVLSSFALAVFGTFNVRSGLVASVHSFAQSEVGPYFLVLLGLVVAASGADQSRQFRRHGKRVLQGLKGGHVGFRVAPVNQLDRAETMLFDGVDGLRIKDPGVGGDAEGAVVHVASGTPGNLRQFGGDQGPCALAVEFAGGGEGDMIDIHVKAHADGVGGDKDIDLASLIHGDLGVTGSRA